MIRIRNKMNPSDELIVTRGAYNNLYMKMGYEEVPKIDVIVNDLKDDITLKPTNIKIEKNSSLKVKTLSFEELKKIVLDDIHKKEIVSDNDINESETRFNNKRYR